jgi:hypothetical protein
MKITLGKLSIKALAVGTLLGLSSFMAEAKEPTAYDLIKEGNRYVGEQAKNKIVAIRSEKSVNDIVPSVWTVVFYDSGTTAKATAVKFGSGKMMSVGQPVRVWAAMSGKSHELDSAKLKVDSDKALKTALKEPVLERVKVVASEMVLELYQKEPAWRVSLFAEKLKDSSKDARLGEVIISTETGDVIKNELKINKVQ